jgi:hypothetical protein
VSSLPWLCLLDRSALIAALRQVAGRRFVGVVDVYDAIELVFAEGGPSTGNLIPIYTADRWAGEVAFGGVAEPDAYVAGCDDWAAAEVSPS